MRVVVVLRVVVLDFNHIDGTSERGWHDAPLWKVFPDEKNQKMERQCHERVLHTGGGPWCCPGEAKQSHHKQ